MNKVEAIIRPQRLDRVKDALAEAGYVGLSVVNVTGRGTQRGIRRAGRAGETVEVDMLPKVRMDVVVRSEDVDRVVEIIVEHARTGNIGDGKIFVSPVAEAIRVRTGERGEAAL